MGLSDLPGWKNLTPKEKKQLKKTHGDRFKQGYNTDGKLSVSKKELKRGKQA